MKFRPFVLKNKTITNRNIIDVKTSYVAFRLFRLGAEIVQALPFLRDASDADVLITITDNERGAGERVTLIHR